MINYIKQYFKTLKINSKTKIKSLRFCTWKGLKYIRLDKEGIEDTNTE